MVVFYSDNGGNIHCGLEETDAKGEKYVTAITRIIHCEEGRGIREGGIRVPAVIVWPGVTKPGSINETRIQANDLYPTVLKMMNMSYPKNHVIDGVDFTKALKGKTFERKPMFTFRTRPWKHTRMAPSFNGGASRKMEIHPHLPLWREWTAPILAARFGKGYWREEKLSLQISRAGEGDGQVDRRLYG